MNAAAKTLIFSVSAVCGLCLFVAKANAEYDVLNLLDNSEAKSPDIK